MDGGMNEAARISQKLVDEGGAARPILPYSWYRYHARRSSAEHLIATKALRRTATAWTLIVAQCSAILRQDNLSKRGDRNRIPGCWTIFGLETPVRRAVARAASRAAERRGPAWRGEEDKTAQQFDYEEAMDPSSSTRIVSIAPQLW